MFLRACCSFFDIGPKSALGAVCLISLGLLSGDLFAQTDERKVPVGISGRLEQVVIPGDLLEERPIDGNKTPIVLRIEASFKHGSDHRYDLVYYGLEPGKYNLIDYLRYPDGKPFTGDQVIEVVVFPVLPADVVKPNAIEIRRTGRFGGYRTTAIIAGIVWVFGLILIVTVGRHRKPVDAIVGPLSLADRLRPIIESASSGSATHRELADLERILVAYWRHKLNLDSIPSAQAIGKLREHDESGPLLLALESWLHRPDGNAYGDVEALLAPYRDLPADDLGLGEIG